MLQDRVAPVVLAEVRHEITLVEVLVLLVKVTTVASVVAIPVAAEVAQEAREQMVSPTLQEATVVLV
jgi:hypothetical protein